MSHCIPIRALPRFAALFIAFMHPATGQAQDTQDEQPQLRLICVSGLTEDHAVVLASRDAAGEWQEHGTATLRSSMITDWLPARTGELHLTVREEGALKSICRFTYPAGCRRALAVLIPIPEEEAYEAHLVDPAKAGFVKGSVLIFNFTTRTGLVSLGSEQKSVEAGERLIVKPTPDENRMYRKMASYLDADGEAVSCFDRYSSDNPDSHNMLFLLPDESIGMKVLSLPVFGSLD